MKIYLSTEEVKQLQAFVSKDKSRFILQGICITPMGGHVEFAATNGNSLLIIRRKVDQSETLPEKQIVLKMPKLKYKGIVLLEDIPGHEGCCYVWTNGAESKGLADVLTGATYPNYNLVAPLNYRSMPKAAEYVGFSAESLERLEKVIPQPFKQKPWAQNAKSPHIWDTEIDGRTKVVVIMPFPAR